MIDDMELLRRYVQGSEEAFAELVRRHLDFVYAAALRRSRNAHRAQEVAQTVFIALARKAGTLLDRREIVGWLFISAQYSTVSLIRSESRRTARQETAHLLQRHNGAASPQEDWQTMEPFLDAAMEALSESERSAVLLRFFKNHSFAEIGALLSVSEDAARKRVVRALEKVRRFLARQGITSTATAIAVAMLNQPAVCAPTGLGIMVTHAAIGGGAITASASMWSGLLSAKLAVFTLVVAAGAALLLVVDKTRDGNSEMASDVTIVRDERLDLRVAASHQRAPFSAGTGILGEDRQGSNKSSNASPAATPASADRTARNRAVIVRRYGPLYEELKLSAEKRDRLTQVLLDSRNASADFAAANALTGQDPTEDEELFSASIRVLKNGLNEQIQEVLGNEGYNKFLLADQKVRQIAIVERLEKRLRRTPNFLSASQIAQLKSLVVEYQIDSVNEEIIARAQQYLTLQQVQALREIKAHAELGLQKPPIKKAISENLRTTNVP
jgi:RNA polymerase sigma factor (sigma-70 family)